MKYKVIFNAGKPYEEEFNNIEDLQKGLKDFYLKNKDSGYEFDSVVYDENGQNITDSQIIDEMVGDILNEN